MGSDNHLCAAVLRDDGVMKKIRVLIEDRVDAAKDVVRLVLRRPDGERLPAFTAGAHVDLFLPNGLTRQYSLISDCSKTDCYEVAVSKATNSRGGSSCVHSTLRVGGMLDISEPRNNFPLQPEHDRFLFIAGGIGITPILSMIRNCESRGWNWRLLYLARSHPAGAAGTQACSSFRTGLPSDQTIARQKARASVLARPETADGLLPKKGLYFCP
jgi:vanillate O-demethylase ferredoxin subunit